MANCGMEWCPHSEHWPEIEAVNQARRDARAYMDALERAEKAEAELATVTERAEALQASGNMLANTVALMNSMIRSGESHSPTSERVMRESLDAFRSAAAGAGQEGGAV